jgi:hypothetical protein
MKKITVFITVILSISIVVFAASKSYGKKDIIAKLDGQPITKEVLEKYVKDLNLSKQYKKMLKTEKGLKKLTESYISRQIILDYAKKKNFKDSHFVKQHMMSKDQDKDAVLISAVLSKEINEKITVMPEEIDARLKETNSKDRKNAYFELMSIKRQKKFNEFMNKLKKQHKIEYF